MNIGTESVRIRATVGATLVAAVVVTIAAVVLVITLRESQFSAIDNTLELRATDIESLLDGGGTPLTVAVESDEDGFVQIVDGDGNVVAASANLGGQSLVTPTVGSMTATERIDALDETSFRVHRRVTDGDRRFTIVVGTTLEDLERNQRVLSGSLIVGIPLVLFVLAGLIWTVVGRALRPVEAIRARVTEIDGGQLDQRVPVPAAQDEIGRLATTMNHMLDRLQDAQHRQTRFVSDASHELRTPIAVIRHELEIALRTEGTDHWPEVGADLLEEDLRMERLVDDLLFIARHERPDTDADRSLVELVDVDDLVLDEVGRGHTAKPIDVSGVSAGQVRGNADNLARVIRNLLDNAARYATSGVAVHVASHDGVVTVDIDDDGPGVPDRDREMIFERFARSDDARGRMTGGTGLGLAIASDIVEQHGGTITVAHSPWLGGARFTVTLADART
ncbi:MAG: ATP-binding protein [Ilumatobacteraceae bacterium]